MPAHTPPTVPDTRRLEQFVAVAETETLAAAAERLFITQQALSTAIRRLEREIGVTLFHRKHRRLTLTPAGEDLLEGARPLLAGARRLTESVRRSAHGSVPAFVVGHSPALSSAEVFSLIEPVLDDWPDTSVTVRQVFPDNLHDELISGSADLVLRRGVTTPDGLTSAIVAYQPMRLAVVADHPLAARDRIRIADDLATHPVIVWAPERRSFYTDFLVSHCRRAGIEPELRINRVQGTPPATAALVDREACVFVTDPRGPTLGGRVVVKDFETPPLSPVQALWLPHTVSRFRTAMLAALDS